MCSWDLSAACHRQGSWASRLAYSFGFRSPQKVTGQDSPGPGQYDLGGVSSGGRAATMGKRVHAKDTSDAPGPGAYNPASPGLSAGRAFTMYGRTAAPEKESCGAVGPGQYDPKPVQTGRAFTMGARLGAERAPETPGPGEYDANRRATGESPPRLTSVESATEK